MILFYLLILSFFLFFFNSVCLYSTSCTHLPFYYFFLLSFLSFSPLLHFPPRSLPSLLLVPNIIFDFLLTLSSFTRFSLCCLNLTSLILLPILTLLPSSLFIIFLSLIVSLLLFLHAQAILSSFSLVSRQSVSLSFFVFSFRFTSVERDSRVSRYRRRG